MQIPGEYLYMTAAQTLPYQVVGMWTGDIFSSSSTSREFPMRSIVSYGTILVL